MAARAPAPAVFTAVLQRKDPKLPVYTVVPGGVVSTWGLAGTTMVEGTVNGHALGRRSMKRWSSAPDADWFVEYTAPFCALAGIAVGDRLAITLWPADSGLPAELEAPLGRDPVLRSAWDRLSEYVRRTQMEHVRAGKSAATRGRRAAAILQRLAAVAAPPGGHRSGRS